MTQEIIAFAALFLAIAFLVRKFFWKKKKSAKGCDGCG